MAIVGIESVIYGVSDLAKTTDFFSDYGLERSSSSGKETVFTLPVGSKVVLRSSDDPELPAPYCDGPCVRETILGVDTPEALDALIAGLAVDREVKRDADGTAHFRSDDDIPFGLRLFKKKPLQSTGDPANAPGAIRRLNQMRQWQDKARPQTINHVVYGVKNYAKTFAFMRDRLGFRLTDHSADLGVFLRADGANEHHTLFFARSKTSSPPEFWHVAFGVEDLDEVMCGANYMTRHGWNHKEQRGLARHRISSALFYYFRCPAGGEVEYHADTDYMDDNWVPRVWDATYGYIAWMHDLPEFLMTPPAADWAFDPDGKSLQVAMEAA